MKITVYVYVVLLQAVYALSCVCPNPQPVSTDIKYNLYKKCSPHHCQPEQINPDNLNNITFNSNSSFIIIAHGFSSNAIDPNIKSFISERFKRNRKVNIITVDWSSLTGVTNCTYYIDVLGTYLPLTASRTCCTGDLVGDAIIKLIAATNSSPKHFHLIGFSVGAHLMGCAGQYVYKTSGKQIARITGLDSTGSVFQEMGAECRLSANDAKFVDCYHTNDGKAGFSGSLGHVDVIVNGGKKQLPCSCDPDSYHATYSHKFSWKLYIESVNSPVPAYRDSICPKCTDQESNSCDCVNPAILVGYNINKNVTGTLQVETNSCSPYARYRKNTCSDSSSSESREHWYTHWK